MGEEERKKKKKRSMNQSELLPFITIIKNDCFLR